MRLLHARLHHDAAKSLDVHSDPDDETIKQHLQQAVQPAR
jgi:hypothetical protein